MPPRPVEGQPPPPPPPAEELTGTHPHSVFPPDESLCGAAVWALFGPHPWWPAVVLPTYLDPTARKSRTKPYYIHILGEKPSLERLSVNTVVPFQKGWPGKGSMKVGPKLQSAMDEAESLIKMSDKEKIVWLAQALRESMRDGKPRRILKKRKANEDGMDADEESGSSEADRATRRQTERKRAASRQVEVRSKKREVEEKQPQPNPKRKTEENNPPKTSTREYIPLNLNPYGRSDANVLETIEDIFDFPYDTFEDTQLVEYHSDVASAPLSISDNDYPDNNDFVCNVCETPGELVCCEGDCLSSFHPQCLKTKLRGDNFSCEHCEMKLHPCLICKRLCQFGEKTVKCLADDCGAYYHHDCLSRFGNFENFHAQHIVQRSVCPRHVCAGCSEPCSFPDSTKCTRCPLAYHRACRPIGSIERHDHHFTCGYHIIGERSKRGKKYFEKCLHCMEDGPRLYCDGCPAAYHRKCLRSYGGFLVEHRGEQGEWFCPCCVSGRVPEANSIIWAKHGSFPWWPAKIISESRMPKEARRYKHEPHEFPICYLGEKSFGWADYSTVIPWDSPYGQEILVDPAKPKLIKGYAEAKSWFRRKCHIASFREGPDKFVDVQSSRHYLNDAEKLLITRGESPCSCSRAAGGQGTTCSDKLCKNWATNTECSPKLCPVGNLCKNQEFTRVVNNSLRPAVKASCAQYQGWGVFATKTFEPNAFIMEIVGDYVPYSMAIKRIRLYASYKKKSQIRCFKLPPTKNVVLDATAKSNISRLMNPCLSPDLVNARIEAWRVKGWWRLCVKANTHIRVGEEITADFSGHLMDVREALLTPGNGQQTT